MTRHGRRPTAAERRRAKRAAWGRIRRARADHRRAQQELGLPVCTSPDCWCYPWYGRIPEPERASPLVVMDPDPDWEGFGAHLCPACRSTVYL